MCIWNYYCASDFLYPEYGCSFYCWDGCNDAAGGTRWGNNLSWFRVRNLWWWWPRLLPQGQAGVVDVSGNPVLLHEEDFSDDAEDSSHEPSEKEPQTQSNRFSKNGSYWNENPLPLMAKQEAITFWGAAQDLHLDPELFHQKMPGIWSWVTISLRRL